jgi:hypothetical protein
VPEGKPSDNVDKLLLGLKSMEDRKQGLIDDLLRQRDAAIKVFDEEAGEALLA